MQRRGRSLFAAVAGALLSGGCTLILDFDDPPAPPDAMVPDAIPDTACMFGEDNDSRTRAYALTPVTGQVAGICDAGDHDYYSLQVATGQALTFEIVFDQQGARGDLDLRLLDVNGQLVAQSISADRDEKIVCPGEGPHCGPLVAGNYFVEVYGYSDTTTNAYTIDYTLTP